MLGEAGVTDTRADLRADCSSCVGLCCVALSLVKSNDFPRNKPAGQPCHNLQQDYSCGIHARLREEGWKGCTVYDCFGAGQKVTQHTFEGRSWHEDPALAAEMFEVFPTVRQLHELLWYLRDVTDAVPALSAEAATLHDEIAELAAGSAASLRATDVTLWRGRVGELLGRASATVRASTRAESDLAGRRMRRADLSDVSLRNGSMLATDLREAKLTRTDLLGADTRDADVRGADLAEALFLTQMQLNAMNGDGRTRVPLTLQRPPHWDAGARSEGTDVPSPRRQSRRR